MTIRALRRAVAATLLPVAVCVVGIQVGCRDSNKTASGDDAIDALAASDDVLLSDNDAPDAVDVPDTQVQDDGTDATADQQDADAAAAYDADSAPDSADAPDAAPDTADATSVVPDAADVAEVAPDGGVDALTADQVEAGSDAATPDDGDVGADAAQTPDAPAAIDVTVPADADATAVADDADAATVADDAEAAADADDVADGIDPVAVCDSAACPAPTDTCHIAVCNTDNTCGFGLAADGTACDDSDACTTNACSDGACVGVKKTCNDGSACTDDSCDPTDGCIFAPNTGACDDLNACTLGDTCAASVCMAGAVTACDDGNACTLSDVCAGGACAGVTKDCTDGNVCTDDGCAGASGCVHVNNTASCDDGNACSAAEACALGVCSSSPVTCDDQDPCTTDSCNPVSGCVATPLTGPGNCACTGKPGQVCTTDKGVWTQLVAAGLPLARTRALAVNASGEIFATLYGYGVYKSTDGGASFIKLGKPNTVNDPVYLTVTTMGLNHLGEPVVGVITPGSGLSPIAVVRFNALSNSWETAKLSQNLNLGGYFAVGFHQDTAGALISSWPFRNDIQRSTDGGSTWATSYPIPNAAHTPPNGPSALVKAVYGTNVDPVSGELFCGTEGDQWWHSTDNGGTWAMIDAGGTSPIATEPGQNGFLVTFNKDHELLIGTQGKPAGRFLQRWTADGAIVDSDKGFGAWAMVGTATMGTVLREVALTTEGYNFMAMPVNNGAGGSLPCELYGSADGANWNKMDAPFVPELNAVTTHGDAVLVGGSLSSPGTIWKFRPKIANLLPKVSTGVAPGVSLSCGLAGLTLSGTAADPEGAALTYAWKSRGPGTVTFATPTSATTSAAFSVAGDYVLTLLASDGLRSAGAPVIVHVSGN